MAHQPSQLPKHAGPSVPSSVTVKEGTFDLETLVKLLTQKEVLVGFPEETTERKNKEDPASPMTNAAIAYVQDNGMPEKNIPARPFMRPGIEKAQDAIEQQLARALRAALYGRPEGLDRGLHGAGLAAQRGIQNRIGEGIPPPLSERTLQARARRNRQGAILELERRAHGEDPSIEFATPLMDTGELRQAVKYAIRDREERE